ncbi:MAG: preprotein translocase subunit SecG [Rhodothermales bacterium]|nr:preprotein translocase subunit SecG [Rhodothermales bacterium]
MFIFLIIVITLIGLVMGLLVLLQSGKGGGLAGIAAGGATTQILGARQAPDVLEKATWICATLFIVLCILSNFAIDTGERRESIIQQGAQQQGTQPLAPLPDDAQQAPAPAPAPEGGAEGDQ